MIYKLIDAYVLEMSCKEVNDMPCIYADLPNGLDGGHYTMTDVGRECENVSDEPQYFQCSECKKRGTIRKTFDNKTRFSFCPDCGAKVRKAVKQ